MAWIDALFKRMVEIGASDLHMTSNRKPMLRLHGDMVTVEKCSEIKPEQMKQILFEIAPKANQKEFDADNDTDFAYSLPGVARFRCNLFADHSGTGGVFRVIPEEILTAQDLNLPKAVMDFCFMSKGLVVVTGPTGSGKSTTLAAMVDHINKNRCDHIITIEDPIEFVHPDHQCLVNQREVGGHTESFKRALRAALREDPDIILVGEMRDLETIEIAIETAETGHLVFGTLHTTTAASTVDRIIDQFPADRQAQIRTMLSTSLKGVVAQTLCRKKKKGRVAALEVMVVNNAISSHIREGKTFQIPTAMQMGAKLGMRLLNDSLADLVANDVVEAKEAYMKSIDKEGLLNTFSAKGIQFDRFAMSADTSTPAPAPEEEEEEEVPEPVPPPGPGPGGPPSTASGGGVMPTSAGGPVAPLPSDEEMAEGGPASPSYQDAFEQFRQQRKS